MAATPAPDGRDLPSVGPAEPQLRTGAGRPDRQEGGALRRVRAARAPVVAGASHQALRGCGDTGSPGDHLGIRRHRRASPDVRLGPAWKPGGLADRYRRRGHRDGPGPASHPQEGHGLMQRRLPLESAQPAVTLAVIRLVSSVGLLVLTIALGFPFEGRLAVTMAVAAVPWSAFVLW